MQLANSDNPLITVVTVVLNGKRNIENTILSVINQTYDNVEYIIVDGGSTDGTLDIIKKYGDQIDCWASEPDKGIYDAMNKAIDLASGKWINFLNCGDSFFNKDVLKIIFSEKQTDDDVLFGDTQFIYADGTRRILTAGKTDEFWKGLPFYHQSVFVKTALAKLHKFNLEYEIAADFDFLLNLYQKQYRFLDTKIIVSNMAAGGLSYNKRLRAFQDCRRAVRKHLRSRKVEWYYFILLLKIRLNFFIRRMLSPGAFMFLLNLKDRLNFFAELLRLGILSKTFQFMILLFEELIRKLYSNEKFYGFHFDLTGPITEHKPRIPVNFRTLQRNDILRFFNFRAKNYNYRELRKALEVLLFIKSGMPSCYVGTTGDEYPCVMCWLIEPDSNRQIQSYFRKSLPYLETDEVLCEYVFTHPQYRGRNLMGWITSRLFKIASEKGFSRATAFVNEKNTSSLETCPRIGWRPFLVKKVRRRFFRRNISFESFSAVKNH